MGRSWKLSLRLVRFVSLSSYLASYPYSYSHILEHEELCKGIGGEGGCLGCVRVGKGKFGD